jgi:hypothetical protein
MAKVTNRKITEYHFDSQNINKGSEYGDSLLEKSIQEAGLGRSVLSDKNNILIAGNKTLQKAAELGFTKVVEIETDGKELVVVKRKDLDINTAQGIRHKILDNTVSKHNYREDAEMVATLVEPAEITNLNEYGLSSIDKEDGDGVSFNAHKHVIKIALASEQELEYCLKDINYLMMQKYPGAQVNVKGKS